MLGQRGGKLVGAHEGGARSVVVSPLVKRTMQIFYNFACRHLVPLAIEKFRKFTINNSRAGMPVLKTLTSTSLPYCHVHSESNVPVRPGCISALRNTVPNKQL